MQLPIATPTVKDDRSMSRSIALDPLRPPDWRYRRASSLILSGRPASRVSDDLLTRELHAVLRSLRHRPMGGELSARTLQSDPLAAAFALHASRHSICPIVEAH